MDESNILRGAIAGLIQLIMICHYLSVAKRRDSLYHITVAVMRFEATISLAYFLATGKV